MAAFTAFATIAASIKSSQREDVRSVGILLYSGKSLPSTAFARKETSDL